MRQTGSQEPKPRIEQNTPFSVYPSWQPPQTVIAISQEDAMRLHQRRWVEVESNLDEWTVVYCDGSEREGYVCITAKMQLALLDQYIKPWQRAYPGSKITKMRSIKSALERAKGIEAEGNSTHILITGSLQVVGEALRIIGC